MKQFYRTSLAGLVVIIFGAIMFVQSCSKEEGVVDSPLMTDVIASQEYLNFTSEASAFSESLSKCIATLSEAERIEFKNNVHDIKAITSLFEKNDLLAELDRFKLSTKKFTETNSFQRLSKEEKLKVVLGPEIQTIDEDESIIAPRVKASAENGGSCLDIRDKSFKELSKWRESELDECDIYKSIGDDTTYYVCVSITNENYKKNSEEINRDYQKCVANSKIMLAYY